MTVVRLTPRLKREGITRENAMTWAMRTATIGEDCMAILARAQLYEEYILGPFKTASAPLIVGEAGPSIFEPGQR
jgi:hypothetical protein